MNDAEVAWEPDGHQASMIADADCRSVACVAICRDRIDVAAVQAAFDALLSRHSMLRSHYARAADGRLLLVTPTRLSVSVALTDLRGVTPSECQQAVLKLAESFRWSPDDLYQKPLVGCTAVLLSEEVILFLVGAHHSVADAVSLNIIRRDLVVLYRAALLGVAPPLEPITIEYRDFVLERARWLDSDEAIPHLDYWRSVLAGSHSLFWLPYDRRFPPSAGAVRPDVGDRIPRDVLGRLREIAVGQRTTLATVFFALMAVVLARWSGRADTAAWICHSGRTRIEHFRIVGCFIDHWLLRLEVLPVAPFIDVLRRVHQLTVAAMPHVRVTVHRLVPELQRRCSGELQPAIVLNFMPYAKASGVSAPPLVPGLPRIGPGLSKGSPLALIVDFYEFVDHLEWTFAYSSHLFEETTIRRVSTMLSDIARGVARDPYRLAGDLAREPLSNYSTCALPLDWSRLSSRAW